MILRLNHYLIFKRSQLSFLCRLLFPVTMTVLSICVGVSKFFFTLAFIFKRSIDKSLTFSLNLLSLVLGLLVSYIYKHTTLSDFPKLESSLLFLFCYCCYATAEAIHLSGIMALFFNGIVLSHYNSYTLHKQRQSSSLRRWQ